MTGESCLIKLVKLIRIEVFCFLYFFAYGFSNVTLNQTIQDKVCLHIHNLTAEICRDLQKQPDYYIQATDIYRRNTKWNSYMTLIVSIPGIIITLFLGRWLDNYPRFFRFALAAPPLGSVIAVSIVLYQTFYFEIRRFTQLYPYHRNWQPIVFQTTWIFSILPSQAAWVEAWQHYCVRPSLMFPGITSLKTGPSDSLWSIFAWN